MVRIVLISCFIVNLLINNSCFLNRNRSNEFEDIQVDSLNLVPVCFLRNNYELLGEIESFGFLTTKLLYVTSKNPVRVYVYDIEGNQRFLLGDSGRGPYEYLSPKIVRQSDNKFFIWCSDLLKLIEFSENGVPLCEYYGIGRGIKDIIIKDDYAYIYNVSGFDEGIVSVFCLSSSEFTGQKYGEVSHEHEILNLHQCSGGLLLYSNKLLFAPANKLEINVIEYESASYKDLIYVTDENFKIDEFHNSITDLLMDPEFASKLYSSSIVLGLYKTEKHFVLRAETGKVQIERNIFKDISKRFQKFYMLNYETFEVEYSITSNLFSSHNSCYYASDGIFLYTIGFDISNEHYVVYKLDFDNYSK
jgi:hypothetical protein